MIDHQLFAKWNQWSLYKPTLYVLIGPPCSGKSTFCKERLRKSSKTVRINRDCYRDMLRKPASYKFNRSLENSIYLNQHQLALECLNNGYDVILDNTHCDLKTLKEVFTGFKDHAEIKFIGFDVPLWKLKLRNILRTIKKGPRALIPIHVIESMYNKFQKLKLDANNYIFGVKLKTK